jgi:thymidine phosphorylase
VYKPLAARPTLQRFDGVAPPATGSRSRNPSPTSGFVSRCDARILDEVVRDLGGGRYTEESGINYDVGVDALVKPGEAIRAGGVLTRIHAADRAQADAARARLKAAFDIPIQPTAPQSLIAKIIL